MMKKKQSLKQITMIKCSVDGDTWYDIPEILALCAINDHYAPKNHETIIQKYNKGHIIPVEYVLYKKPSKKEQS